MTTPPPDDTEKLKAVEFYSASVSAWLNTRMEYDKSLLTISAAGIGLLTTLMMAYRISSIGLLLLYIFAIIWFLIAILSVLFIFKRNSTHIEQVSNGDNSVDNVLTILDWVALIAFSVGVFFSACIGIGTAISSYNCN